MKWIVEHSLMNVETLTDQQKQWIQQTIDTLSLEQKVGQLFCPMMMEDNLTAEEQIEEFSDRAPRELERFQFGGYYLNRYYLPSTTHLLNILQKRSAIPLFICADMEAGAGGGLNGVIAPQLVTFPPAMGIGATGSERYAYLAARHTAEQARAIGVNYIFAPDLDVNCNPQNPIINIRSYGEDPEQVTRLGIAAIRGFQDGGVIACAKHFPGHGDTIEDSHLALSKIDADRQRLDQVELYPFRTAIAQTSLDSIMTAHLSVPALEPDAQLPATLSSNILQNLLRTQYRFDGLIVTDALLMGAVTWNFSAGDAALKAFLAGADWLLMSPQTEESFQAVYQAVKQKIITSERLEASLRRILALKAKIGLHQPPRVDTHALLHLDELNHTVLHASYTICNESVTLLKNENRVLPLDPHSNLLVLLMNDHDDGFYDQGFGFFHEISSRSPQTDCVSINLSNVSSLAASIESKIKQSDVVVVGMIIAVMPEKGSVAVPRPFDQILRSTTGQNKQTVLCSFGNPYIIQEYPQIPAYLCAYHYFDPMVSSVAEVLFGERIPHGKMPVAIPGICEVGTGLTY